MTKGNLYVAKFGGTSVTNYTAMLRCARIVQSRSAIRLVVVSAPAGITHSLVRLVQLAKDQQPCESLINEIRRIIEPMASMIAIPKQSRTIGPFFSVLADQCCDLSRNYNTATADAILAFGEQFSAYLLTHVLNAQGVKAVYVDARLIMRTDSQFGHASPKVALIKAMADRHIQPKVSEKVVVTEGFIGADAYGATTTLGRGGSDYSAALFAEALQADALMIWTDVAGIYSADPRVAKNAVIIDQISVNEAAELATFGAKVLHPATLLPAVRQGIPAFVGSSLTPDIGGTWVMPKLSGNRPLVRAIAQRKNQVLLTISSVNMLHAQGFLAQVFAILAQHHISVDLVTTSEVRIALTIDYAGAHSLGQATLTDEVLAELRAMSGVQVDVQPDLALIALVGNRLHSTPGFSGQVFSCLSDINIRLLCHGASPHNLCFLVMQSEADQVIQSLHQRFFSNEETLV